MQTENRVLRPVPDVAEQEDLLLNLFRGMHPVQSF